ncbi:MAG TPA: GDSL-type esterase/lipase family protein [Rhizomicrobium sp.]|jgi:lysophospholipase L1-like esterase|nr:GDSL-type esterase/lipase family protein [Rhizomicrobium sp.]
MQALALSDVARLLEGAVDVRRRSGSIQPLRYPAAEAPFYDPFTRWVASAPSGVRLRLRSDTRALHLSLNQRVAAFNGEPRPAPWDLFIDGKSYRQKSATGGAALALDGGLVGDERATLAFDDVPAGDKHIELWLPQSATVSLTALELDDGASWTPWPDTRQRILFHGSSITHCMEADTAAGAWPAVAASLANAAHINLGWAGSCLLSGLAARIIRDQRADAIVLKLGINVHGEGLLKERTFADSAHAMLSIVREKHAATPIVVISPIWSPPREDAGADGGLSLRRMRELLEQVVAARHKSGDAHIRYLSGLELFGPADRADLPDELHPNGAGYRRMGTRFARLMLEPGGFALGRAAA